MLHVVQFLVLVAAAYGLGVSKSYSNDFTNLEGSRCSNVQLTVNEFRRHAQQLASCSGQYLELDNCCQLRAFESLASGVYSVQGYKAVCDMISSGGGWMVIQRRNLSSGERARSFMKNWTMYEHGFGNVDGDFWLGLEALHKFTSIGSTELLIDLVANKSRASARYDHFSVANSSSHYTLIVSGFSGSIPDYLSLHSGSPFSVVNEDAGNNISRWLNCDAILQGGWWFAPQCGPVIPHTNPVAILWGNLIFTEMEMKIRPHHWLCGT